MNAADLGVYAPGYMSWRRALAAAAEGNRLPVFRSACREFAGYVTRGLDRTIAADALFEMSEPYSPVPMDADTVQTEIAEAFEDIIERVPEDLAPNQVNGKGKRNGAAASKLEVWDAGEPFGPIAPREWLLGYQFCRGFISSLVAAGGVGKTALRMLQFMSLALGKSLCGQHIYRRSRVLILNFEDDQREMKRRMKAVLDFYKVDQAELKGWLMCTSPPKRSKLAFSDKRDRKIGPLVKQIREAIEDYQPDLVSLDPFVKTHSLEENDSGDMDYVCDLLAEIASEYNVAIDSPHHVHKGVMTPGDADSGRGSSGIKDAARLVYTLVPMNEKEATEFGVGQQERHSYVRLDPAKINIAVHSSVATWFCLHGQNISNATSDYPNGDAVQVVEPWKPPERWEGTDSLGLNKILDDIAKGDEDGRRYSNAPAAKDRAVWPLVRERYPDKTEAQCRQIIHAWLESGLLYPGEYQDPVARKPRKGLLVNDAKRPS